MSHAVPRRASPIASSSAGAHRERGQAIAELAIVAPVLLLVLMLVAVDFGRLFFSYIAVQNAAREATSYAAFHAADTPWDGTAYRSSVSAPAARRRTSQGQGGAGTVTISDPTCYVQDTTTTMDCHAASNFAAGIGNQVSVSATQPFTFVTPIIGDLFGGPLTLSAAARGPIMNPADVIDRGCGPTPSPTASPTPSPSPDRDRCRRRDAHADPLPDPDTRPDAE